MVVGIRRRNDGPLRKIVLPRLLDRPSVIVESVFHINIFVSLNAMYAYAGQEKATRIE